MSFLPEPYKHPFEIDPKYSKSVAYFSSEFAIDQTLKIYSGGLGFLAGSHMRSAYELKQNMIGIGILWTYGYYDQARGENRQMAVQQRKKLYHFLQETDIKYTIKIHDHDVWVKVMYLPASAWTRVYVFEVAPAIHDLLVPLLSSERDHLNVEVPSASLLTSS